MLRRLLRSTALVSPAAIALMLAGCVGGPQVASRDHAPGPQLAQANMSAAANSSTAASPAADDAGDFSTHDPLEKANRVVFDIDMTLDKYALRPVAKAYRDNVPGFMRTGVTNVLHNIESPIILANDLLQGNMPRFGQTFARIWMNTILGTGGFNDVAGKAGIPFHDADFGQTLGVWGVGPGPYLVLPILGPSDPRDFVGFGVDSVGDPFGFAMREAGVGTEASLSEGAVKVIDDRSHTIDELDELQRNSLDFYATIRSLYQQKRQGDIHDGRTWPPAAAPKPPQHSQVPVAVSHAPWPNKEARQMAHVPRPYVPPQTASAPLDLHLPMDMSAAHTSVLNAPQRSGGAS